MDCLPRAWRGPLAAIDTSHRWFSEMPIFTLSADHTLSRLIASRVACSLVANGMELVCKKRKPPCQYHVTRATVLIKISGLLLYFWPLRSWEDKQTSGNSAQCVVRIAERVTRGLVASARLTGAPCFAPWQFQSLDEGYSRGFWAAALLAGSNRTWAGESDFMPN